MSSGTPIQNGSLHGLTPSVIPETEQTDIDKFETCELTDKQKSQWQDTATMMGWTCPGFRHLWYKLLDNSGGNYTAMISRAVPIAATDAKNIIINPDNFFDFTLPERVFICAHEVIHNIYGDVELLHRCMKTGQVPMHDGTSLPFDNEMMQMAMDYRINALLKESKIGRPPGVGAYNSRVTGADSVLDVYKDTYKKRPDGDEDDEGDGPGSGGFDKLLPPGNSTGQNPATALQQRNQQQWAVEVAAAQTLEQMRAQGNMAAGLKRLFKEILEPEIDWTEQIRTELARKVGSGSYNWRRGDRRYIGRDIFLPSQSGFGAGHIVIWGDTSGSRGDSELASSIAEIASIIEDVHPRRLTVLWGDSDVSNVEELDEVSDLAKLDPRGGGGTDIEPCLAWVAENCDEPPDIFLAFTDGYLTFPEEAPHYPFIWVMNTNVKAPWGMHVRVMKRAHI